MQETSGTQVQPLEKGMATHSSILAWRIPWTEEPSGLQSMGSQRVRHDGATEHPNTHACDYKRAVWTQAVQLTCQVAARGVISAGWSEGAHLPGISQHMGRSNTVGSGFSQFQPNSISMLLVRQLLETKITSGSRSDALHPAELSPAAHPP